MPHFGKRRKAVWLGCALCCCIAAAVFVYGGIGTGGLREWDVVDFTVADADGDGWLEALLLLKMTDSQRQATHFNEVFRLESSASAAEGAIPKTFAFANALFIYKPVGEAADGLSPQANRKTLIKWIANHALEPVYAADFTELRPLAVKTGDVTGDGLTEISVCVYKTTLYHPVYAKRPFIYRLEEDRLVPVWRGSRLSKPFDDYIFADVTHSGVDSLIAIETTAEGRKVLSCYGWIGFGFELKARSPAYAQMKELKKDSDDTVSVIVSDAFIPRTMRFEYLNNENGEAFEDEGRLAVLE